MLPDRAHDPDMANFQKGVAIFGTVFSANGIANRSKDGEVQA
jgi:hypothetical protein